MIYGFAFSTPATGTANPLALLSTCRQIHDEAIEVALRTAQFYLNPEIGFAFQHRLRSLGPLQQQLRQVKVQIPLGDLTFQRATNPFTIIELPLDNLEVNIELPKPMCWLASIRIFSSIASAILYEEACATKMAGAMQRMQLIKRDDWATRAQLHSMLATMRAKSVVVRCKKQEHNLFWAALSQVNVADRTICLMLRRRSEDIRRVDGTKPHRYVSIHASDEEIVMEFGQDPPRIIEVARVDVREL